jgi:hypothetical protein
MSTPQPGQKFIPISEWQRFARVADWYERTIEHKAPGVRRPVYGDDLIVKTPSAGIDARVTTALSSAICTVCVEAETATPGEKVLHETTEETLVHNLYPDDVAGDTYVITSLTASGTRYVSGEPCP